MKFDVCTLIYVSDAKKLREIELATLDKRIKKANKWLQKTLSSPQIKEDDKTKTILIHIQELHQTVKYEIQSEIENSNDLKTRKLIGYMNEIIALLKTIDAQDGLVENILMIESSLILVNSSIRWVKEAQSIIKDRNKATNMASELKEFRRIANTFLRHFPMFLGYRIKTEGDRQGVWIYIEKQPKIIPKGVPPILKTLESEITKLLKWELQKSGENFSVIVTSLKQGSNRMISCETKSKSSDDDNPFSSL